MARSKHPRNPPTACASAEDAVRAFQDLLNSAASRYNSSTFRASLPDGIPSLALTSLASQVEDFTTFISRDIVATFSLSLDSPASVRHKTDHSILVDTTLLDEPENAWILRKSPLFTAPTCSTTPALRTIRGSYGADRDLEKGDNRDSFNCNEWQEALTTMINPAYAAFATAYQARLPAPCTSRGAKAARLVGEVFGTSGSSPELSGTAFGQVWDEEAGTIGLLADWAICEGAAGLELEVKVKFHLGDFISDT